MKLELLSLFLINLGYFFFRKKFIFYIILPFHWNFCQNMKLYLFSENPESSVILGFVFIYFVIWSEIDC